MSRRHSRRGKEKVDGLLFNRSKHIGMQSSEVEDVRERLPERLFATDQFLS
ncbi:unnamed protein product, partial [Brassica rapa subsp. trilocularis]